MVGVLAGAALVGASDGRLVAGAIAPGALVGALVADAVAGVPGVPAVDVAADAVDAAAAIVGVAGAVAVVLAVAVTVVDRDAPGVTVPGVLVGGVPVTWALAAVSVAEAAASGELAMGAGDPSGAVAAFSEPFDGVPSGVGLSATPGWPPPPRADGSSGAPGSWAAGADVGGVVIGASTGGGFGITWPTVVPVAGWSATIEPSGSPRATSTAVTPPTASENPTSATSVTVSTERREIMPKTVWAAAGDVTTVFKRPSRRRRRAETPA